MNLAEDLGDHRLLTDNKVNSWQIGHVPVASYSPKMQACKLRETATTEHLIRRLQNRKAAAFQLLILTECISRLHCI